MKIGSLVFATQQGLGILARSFYDAGIVTDVMVVHHGRHEDHTEWYPGAKQITMLRDRRQIQEAKEFCESMDAMLFFETPFLWELIPHCREHGVKTVLMPMHECLHERVKTHLPDLFLCPSLLDLNCVREYYRTGSTESVFIPVPVEMPWHRRERAEVFVHNAGHGGLKGRNGTSELIDAWNYVKSDARLILRSQARLGPLHHITRCGRVTVEIGTIDQYKLYDTGDVFLFPEKFNGLSLPLQEARAAGMLVMCGDRFPMNTWLPNRHHDVPGGIFNDESSRETRILIPVKEYRKNRIGPPYQEFEEAVFDPQAIAAKIDEWYGKNISEYSESGKSWAKLMSWEALTPKYMTVLESLCE